MPGRVIVYYRGSDEHLNPTNPSAEDSSFYSGILKKDFGHAFLRIDDVTSGDIAYLDGWMLQDGSFFWNQSEDQTRLDDHHNVAWSIGDDACTKGMDRILGIRDSATEYDVWHNNCADMTASVLGEMGLAVSAETVWIPGHGDVALPGRLGAAVSAALDLASISHVDDVDYPVDGTDISSALTEKASPHGNMR